MCLQFSDNYYRAELIEALTNSLTPAISINNEVRTVDNLNGDVRLILEEITRFLNMEKLLPSFRNTITVRSVSERSVFVCVCVCFADVLLEHVLLSTALHLSFTRQSHLKCCCVASFCCTTEQTKIPSSFHLIRQ